MHPNDKNDGYCRRLCAQGIFLNGTVTNEIIAVFIDSSTPNLSGDVYEGGWRVGRGRESSTNIYVSSFVPLCMSIYRYLNV